MANATWAVPSFLGGEISLFAQGRFDRPDYKVSLSVCLNSFPVEIGAWTRRPGTKHAGHSRGGNPSRVVKFDFEQTAAVTKEFTDGFLRFRAGTVLIGTNDDVAITSISTANPAVVNVAAAMTWATGNAVMFPGASAPLLENRQFTITVSDSTHFSLQDALTGANIDGATLGALTAGATVRRVQELATVYVGQSWQNIRAVQAETTDVLLCDGFSPYILSVSTLPAIGISPQFSIAQAVFQDGPYLDPPTNGVQVTPSALIGNITLTLSFPIYVATKAYTKGSFVASVGVNYVSLIDQNIGNTPAGSPSAWQATSAGAAINSGQGFVGTDVGRLVRLLSEPAQWDSTATYAAGNVVSYNPSGAPGAATYWSSITGGNINHPPGSDITNWTLMTANAAAVWTWGKITGLSNVIDRALPGSASIGSLTAGGGLAAAFDGNFSKGHLLCADAGDAGAGIFPAGTALNMVRHVGKNYFGASPQTISQATIYPSTDLGFGYVTINYGSGLQYVTATFTFNLRAKSTAPSASNDGTLLGTTTIVGSSPAVTIVSNDQATSWNYVWVECIVSGTAQAVGTQWQTALNIAQLSIFSPTSSTSAGCTVEILGPSLLYSQPIATWRLGAFSNTTGWPTCGTYAEGRLWVGGAIPNRFDACVSNGIDGANINFAPTNAFGVVATSNAISYTLNSDSVNPIQWMVPELQGIAMGTQAGEWLVVAPTAGPIAPANIAARATTRHGSENISPCRTEHTTIFVKRFGRKLMEYFADVYSGKYSAPNLADKAQHITKPSVVELAYTGAVDPVVWGRDGNNALFGVTYKRDSLNSSQGPTFYAWHRHTLGSGRTVESICAGPSVGGDLDSLTLVTNDATSNIRHVEVLTDAQDELSALADGWFLDDAVNPTSVAVSAVSTEDAPFGGATFNGLWHLNGKTVQVFAAGLDCGDRGDNSAYVTDFLVSNGSIFVPFADSVSSGPGQGLFTAAYLASIALTQVVIGFTYNSDGQLVRRNDPAETGARNGPAFGKLRRNHRYALQMVNTRGISVGCTFGNILPALFRQADGATSIGTLDTFTGIHQDALEDDYSYDGMVCWRVSRPMPATIVAVAVNTATQDQ